MGEERKKEEKKRKNHRECRNRVFIQTSPFDDGSLVSIHPTTPKTDVWSQVCAWAADTTTRTTTTTTTTATTPHTLSVNTIQLTLSIT